MMRVFKPLVGSEDGVVRMQQRVGVGELLYQMRPEHTPPFIPPIPRVAEVVKVDSQASVPAIPDAAASDDTGIAEQGDSGSGRGGADGSTGASESSNGSSGSSGSKAKKSIAMPMYSLVSPAHAYLSAPVALPLLCLLRRLVRVLRMGCWLRDWQFVFATTGAAVAPQSAPATAARATSAATPAPDASRLRIKAAKLWKTSLPCSKRSLTLKRVNRLPRAEEYTTGVPSSRGSTVLRFLSAPM